AALDVRGRAGEDLGGEGDGEVLHVTCDGLGGGSVDGAEERRALRAPGVGDGVGDGVPGAVGDGEGDAGGAGAGDGEGVGQVVGEAVERGALGGLVDGSAGGNGL